MYPTVKTMILICNAEFDSKWNTLEFNICHWESTFNELCELRHTSPLMICMDNSKIIHSKYTSNLDIDINCKLTLY